MSRPWIWTADAGQMTHLSLCFSYNISWKNKYNTYQIQFTGTAGKRLCKADSLPHLKICGKSLYRAHWWTVCIQISNQNYLSSTPVFFVVVFVVVFLVFSPPNLKPEQSNDVILESQGKQLVQIITDLQSGMDLCSNASCWSLLPSHGCIGGCCQ